MSVVSVSRGPVAGQLLTTSDVAVGNVSIRALDKSGPICVMGLVNVTNGSGVSRLSQVVLSRNGVPVEDSRITYSNGANSVVSQFCSAVFRNVVAGDVFGIMVSSTTTDPAYAVSTRHAQLLAFSLPENLDVFPDTGIIGL